MSHYFSVVCVFPNVMLVFNWTSSWHKCVKIRWVFWCLKCIWYYKNTDIPRLIQQLSSAKSSRNHILVSWKLHIWSSAVEIQTWTRWNLIDSNMTALSPVLLPSIILLSPSTHCAFSSTKKTGIYLKNDIF